MTGDRVLCSAESQELKAMGLTAGTTNYSGAYCTGLLLARRLLVQVGLSDMYKGNDKIDGDYYNVSEHLEDKRPFKALLDVGIQRTTTGARLFGVLKGACDGGINVPHNYKRFPGFAKSKVEVIVGKRGKAVDSEKTEASYSAALHRDRIFGVHVTKYMNLMKKDDPAKFKRHFSQWEKCLTANKAKTCEEVYKSIHKKILANPVRVKLNGNLKPTRKVITPGKQMVLQNSKGKKWLREFRITREMRVQRVQDKFAAAFAKAQGN
jgi:large subunit ribosomal protein L5e